MKTRRLFAMCVLGLSIAHSRNARASSFAGTTLATFGTPVPTAGNTYSGVGTNSITLGVGTNGSAPNALTLDSQTFSTPESTDFPVSALTYHNGQTTGTTSPVELPVSLQFDFSDPAGLTKTFSFSFNLVFTPNSSSPLSNPLNDDLLTVPTAYAAQSFSAGGVDYYLKLDGFSNDGGHTIVSTFDLPEDTTATSTLYAQITPVPPPAVPLPAPLFGSLATLASLGTSKWLRRERTAL